MRQGSPPRAAVRLRQLVERAVAESKAGRPREAAAAMRAIEKACGSDPAVYLQAATLADRLGGIEPAVALAARGAGLWQENPEAQIFAGVLHAKADRPAAAIPFFERARSAEPRRAVASYNLGLAHAALEDWAEALGCYDEAVAADPGLAPAWYNKGRILSARADYEGAVEAFRRAVAANPGYAVAHYNLANALRHVGASTAAVESYERALAADPRLYPALTNLAAVHYEERRFEAGALACERAIAIAPHFAPGYGLLSASRLYQGRVDEAIALLRKALALDPELRGLQRNLLTALNYAPDLPPEAVFEEHRAWGERLESRSTPRQRPAAQGDAARRLRIGYVSPDFRLHSVAFFFEPLLREHDRRRFEIFCYSDHGKRDAVTARLIGLADHWRDVARMNDSELLEVLQADGLDLLIDLAGHTGSRLALFTERPARVQATWLGYANTTGLRSIDYRITDALADPLGASDRLATETLIRLPECFLCYLPPAEVAEVAPPPSREAAGFTFGSFNARMKLNERVLDAWSRILQRVPGARLLLKSAEFSDAQIRREMEAALARRGIAPERLAIEGFAASLSDHLARYGAVDLALDPFPYNGTTTTCEAAWMGVPTLTFAGNRHAHRVGATLLGALGLPEFVASDVEDYVARAVEIAGRPDLLGELRGGLRRRLAASPLGDAAGFARRMEAAFERMLG